MIACGESARLGKESPAAMLNLSASAASVPWAQQLPQYLHTATQPQQGGSPAYTGMCWLTVQLRKFLPLTLRQSQAAGSRSAVSSGAFTLWPPG